MEKYCTYLNDSALCCTCAHAFIAFFLTKGSLAASCLLTLLLSSRFRGSFFFFGCGSAGWICPIFVLLPGSMTLTTVFTGAPSAEEVEGGSHRTLRRRGVKQCPVSRIYGPLLRWGP